MPVLDSVTHKIPLPNGVSASIEDNMVVISKDCLLYTSDAADDP